MKTYKYISTLVLIVIISCKKSNSVKSYYTSGNLLSEIEYDIDGSRNGLAKEYFENGNIMKIGNYEKGKLVDTTNVFYENGSKKSIIVFIGDTVYSRGFYENGILKGRGKLNKKSKIKLGWWEYFDKLGKLNNKIEYIKKNGKSYTNQFIVYDDKQEIIKDQSFYYSINSPKTASIKSSSIVEINYSSPYQENSQIYLVIEKNNNDFVFKDSIKMLYNPTQVNLRFDKLGIKRVKGYFLEKYEGELEAKDGDSIALSERRMYFDKGIKVIGN